MYKHLQRNIVLKYFTLLSLGVLISCTALVTPTVETDIAQLEPGKYKLDNTHATLLFKVNHAGVSTYIGRFNDVAATFNFDPANPQDSTLHAIVNMASVDTNNEQIESMLRGDDWFNVAKFPQAQFQTQAVSVVTDNIYLYEGELTFLGQTKPIEVKVTFNGGADMLLTGKYTLGFSAVTTFKRSDFGLTQYIPLVGDEITLEAFAEFQKQ